MRPHEAAHSGHLGGALDGRVVELGAGEGYVVAYRSEEEIVVLADVADIAP